MLNKTRSLILFLILSCLLNTLALDRLSLLPPDSTVSVRVSNLSEFGARLKQSPLGQLWNDPQFQEFTGNPADDEWMDLLFAEASDAKKDILLDQLKMLKGELVIGTDSDLETFCLITTISEEDYLRSVEQDKKLSRMEDSNIEIVYDEFQGVQLARHISNAGTESESSSWQAYLANTMLIGPSREWVERAIIQLKKAPPTEPAGTPTFRIDVNFQQIIANSSADETDDALFDALGLSGVGNGSLTIQLEEDKLVTDSTLAVSDMTKGLFTLIDPQPATLPTVTFIPENMSSLESGRINLLGLWREIPNALSAMSPEGKMQFDMVLGMIREQAQIDIDQDLLSNLGTQYIAFASEDPDTQQQLGVVGIELKDRFAFQTALETALAAPALQPQVAFLLKEETFLEHTIYTVQNQQPGETIAFAIAADRFFYGPPSILRNIIRTQTSADTAHDSFESSPLVRGLRRHTPAGALGFSAIDWQKQMKNILRELDSPIIIDAFRQAFADSDAPMAFPDLGPLPSADHLASFFTTSFQYLEQTDRGLHLRATMTY